MSDKKTQTVIIKRVDKDKGTVTTSKGTSGSEHFPGAKVGDTWKVTTVGNDNIQGGVTVSTRKQE